MIDSKKLKNLLVLVIVSSTFVVGISGATLVWTSMIEYSFLEAVFWTSLFTCIYTLLSYMFVK